MSNLQRSRNHLVDLRRDSFTYYAHDELHHLAQGKNPITSMPSYASLRELASQEDRAPQSSINHDPHELLGDIVDEFNDLNGLRVTTREAENWGLSNAVLEACLKNILQHNAFQDHLHMFVAQKMPSISEKNQVTERLKLDDVIAGFQNSEHGFEITDHHIQQWGLSDEHLNDVFGKRFQTEFVRRSRGAFRKNVQQHFKNFESIYELEHAYFPNLTLNEFLQQSDHHISIEMLIDHFNNTSSPLRVSLADAKQLGLRQDVINTTILKSKNLFAAKMKHKAVAAITQ